jgi:hypothetical protein
MVAAGWELSCHRPAQGVICTAYVNGSQFIVSVKHALPDLAAVLCVCVRLQALQLTQELLLNQLLAQPDSQRHARTTSAAGTVGQHSGRAASSQQQQQQRGPGHPAAAGELLIARWERRDPCNASTQDCTQILRLALDQPLTDATSQTHQPPLLPH